jgi:hypothetical protein
MEALAQRQGRELGVLDLDAWEALWAQAKAKTGTGR